MEVKQLSRRLLAVALLLCALAVCFGGVLYDLQIVNGADYVAQSKRKIPTTETVETARGMILDRHGRVLVDNQTVWQIRLDLTRMGAARDETLRTLLSICRAQGVTWADTLPISQTVPFSFTAPIADTRFTRLADKLGWTYTTTAEAMRSLETQFSIPSDLPDVERRALLGVLYEVALRTREIVWSDYVFAHDVDIALISAVKERNLPGVQVETVTVRRYHTQYAAHILGRVAQMSPDEVETYQELGYAMNELVGKDGVEGAFESYLRGTKGKRAIETDDEGRVVSESWITEPNPGGNVILTLDLGLQQRTEQALAKWIPFLRESQTNQEARGGAAVVIDIPTGEVLSLASYPTFDLTNFVQDYTTLFADPLRPMFNRATQGIYSPGSTYKMVTAVGALEEGVITPSTRILDTGRYTYYSSPQPMCWIYRSGGGTHGWETVSGAITDSCNVFFFDVGRRLGISKLEEYARAFGLGEKTGIELPEHSGVVAGPYYTESQGQRWNDGSTLSAAIGQENNQFTPLQLANYVATLVNGGEHHAAHLLKSVSSHDFATVLHTQTPTVLNQIDITPQHLAAVKAGMRGAAQSYSVAPYFADLGVTVGAKTGSAQVSAASESNAVFVCFAPYDDPQVAIAVVVEHGGAGTQLAAIANDILSFYFESQSAIEQIPGENELIR